MKHFLLLTLDDTILNNNLPQARLTSSLNNKLASITSITGWQNPIYIWWIDQLKVHCQHNIVKDGQLHNGHIIQQYLPHFPYNLENIFSLNIFRDPVQYHYLLLLNLEARQSLVTDYYRS